MSRGLQCFGMGILQYMAPCSRRMSFSVCWSCATPAGIDMKTQRPRLCDIAFSQLLLNRVQIHAGKTGHGLVHQAVGTSKHGLAATGRVAAGLPEVSCLL